MAKIIEFKSKEKYDSWLTEMGDGIKIINVSTTKRWSWSWGFLGDAKTYTITYEDEE